PYVVSVTGENGYSAVTNLSVSGLPAGASGSFNPGSIDGTGTSQLTISTAASLPSGTYPFTVTASSGGVTHTASATLVVVTLAADFTLAVSPSSESVQPGSTTTYTAAISGQNGYSSPTSLSVSGLPTGASGGFSP